MDESTRTTKNTLTVLVYASNHTNVLGIPEMRTAEHSLFCFIGLFLFHLSEPGRRNQRNSTEGSKHLLPSETLNGLLMSFPSQNLFNYTPSQQSGDMRSSHTRVGFTYFSLLQCHK
jgi:hypothetical protein